MSSIQGVLYLRNEKEELRWFEDVDPKTEDGKYVGQIKNGEPCGHGTFTYPNGEKYEGEWKDGKRHGQGTYNDSDGENMKVNGMTEQEKVVEGSLGLMGTNMRERSRMVIWWVKGYFIGLMEISIQGNTRVGEGMVKDHTLILMGENMKDNGKMVK